MASVNNGDTGSATDGNYFAFATRRRPMGQNQVVLRHLIILFPRISGVSERASSAEQSNEFTSRFMAMVECLLSWWQ